MQKLKHGGAGTFRAGVAKVDITNRSSGVWGELLSEKVKKHIPPDYLKANLEVSDPLYARALALEDAEGRSVVLVTMDVTAIGARTISQHILGDSADDFVPRLRRRVEQELGLAGACVNVSASHVHQVPLMLCDDEQQLERTVAAIREARANMAAATLAVGSGREDRLTINRTMMLKDGTDWTVRSYHAPMPADDQVERLRPVDPEIGIVRIDRLDGGRPLAVVYNFGCHVLLGAPDGEQGTITADHVGVSLRYLEQTIGGDVMAFFLQGGLGDAHEACIFDTEHSGTAQDFGTRMGQSVLDAYRKVSHDPEAGERASIALASRTVQLPLRKDVPQVIAAMRARQRELLESLQYTSLNFKAFLPLYFKHALSPAHPSHFAYRYLHAAAVADAGRRWMDERNRLAVEKYLSSIGTMERLAELAEDLATLEKHREIIEQLGGDSVAAEFQAIRIGDAVFVTAPMELLSETSLKVKKSSPFPRTFVVSLSNGYLHYAPPASYYPRGGYEVTECLLDPTWEPAFDRVVRELFEELTAPPGPP